MAHNLYKWVVKKEEEKKMKKRFKKYLIASVGFSLFLSILLTGPLDAMGDAGLWCWVDSPHSFYRWPFFYALVLLSWLGTIYFYSRLLKSFQDRTQGAGQSLDAQQIYEVQRQIRYYELVFIFTWFWGLVNRLANEFSPTPVFITSLLHVMFVPLQGFLNSIIRGGIFEKLRYRVPSNASEGEDVEVAGELTNLNGHKRKTSTTVNNRLVNLTPKKLFISTFNLGEAGLDSTSAEHSIIAGIKLWIPVRITFSYWNIEK
jgi:hypothetical protein